MKTRMMRIPCALAFAGLLAGAAAAGTEQPAGGFSPTPGMVSMMTLGQAGLMNSLFSNEIYGNTQTKIGASRATAGYVNDALIGQGVPPPAWPAFRDRARVFVLPISMMKELPAATGAHFLRINVEPTRVVGSNNLPVEPVGNSPKVELQYFHAPIPSRLLGIGLSFEHDGYDLRYPQDPVNTLGRSRRNAWGLQLRYAEVYTPHWGLAARLDYQRGKASYTVSNLFMRQRQDYDENRFYAQVEWIGTFSVQDIGLLPPGWLLRPVVGANYQRSFFNTASASVLHGKHEDYGAAWVRARVEKQQAPGPQWQFLPSLSLGLEAEYANDVDLRLRDRRYVLASLGLAVVGGPYRFDLEYNLRHGVDSRRKAQIISAVLSYQF